jgi:hypothetical protein
MAVYRRSPPARRCIQQLSDRASHHRDSATAIRKRGNARGNPKRWHAPLVRRATVWALLTGIKGDRKRFYIEHYLADVRLLSRSELQPLFSQPTVLSERFPGFTKSLLALK